MKVQDFINGLNAVNFNSFPRKIEFTAVELAAAGIQANAQVATTLNMLIKLKNRGTTMHFQAEDMAKRAFLNRTATNGPVGEDGKAVYIWQKGQDLMPQTQA